MAKVSAALERGGSPGPKARMHRLQRSICGIPRIFKILLIAFLVLVASDLRIRIQGDFDYRLKILPTDFTTLEQQTPDALWLPQESIRYQNGANIGDHYVFMDHLSDGNEGSASLYVDVPTGEIVVVKTWTGPLKNIRNFIPSPLASPFSSITDKWPSEIEAGLLLATWNQGNDTAYPPVRDYFILRQNVDDPDWHWAMATPYISGGNLLNLASATKFHERTPQKLDKVFRPAFNALLAKLADLHEAGYCHDDIKPDNVFIANTTHWLLGDLGNVRHVEHPWHATGRWKRENQKPDCKENDLRRLMKTYLAFLREAAAERVVFDRSFYQEDQAWSRLYWDFKEARISARQLLTMSKALRSGVGGEVKAGMKGDGGVEACLAKKIDRELTFWTIETTWRDWVPFRGC